MEILSGTGSASESGSNSCGPWCDANSDTDTDIEIVAPCRTVLPFILPSVRCRRGGPICNRMSHMRRPVANADWELATGNRELAARRVGHAASVMRMKAG